MRLTIKKEAILKALQITSRAIDAKSVNPALATTKLELNEKGLEVTGSNGYIVIKDTVPYKEDNLDLIRNSNIGEILIDGRLFFEAIRRMEGEEISLEVVDEIFCVVKDERSNFRLPCLNAAEYPDLNLEPSDLVFSIGCKELTNLIESTAYAASNKDSRPVLTCVNLDAENGILTATATDSARLAKKSIEIEENVTFKKNIPAKTLLDIVHLFENEKEVKVSLTMNKALFFFGNIVYSTRLITDDYPVTRSIIPSVFNYFLEVNANELLACLDRASVLALERDNPTKLIMDEDNVELFAHNDANSVVNENIQTFSYKGGRLEISFNPNFVIDALKNLKAEDVVICFQSEMKPFVVKNPKESSTIYLITPMRTR